jgi:glycosyltransferase involved in cell wall biosynthesis
VPETIRQGLLLNPRFARVLVYTPEEEHFGIVPVEAMSQGIPVIALDSGGPRETVIDGVTGWLCSVDSSKVRRLPSSEDLFEKSWSYGEKVFRVLGFGGKSRSRPTGKSPGVDEVLGEDGHARDVTACLIEVMQMDRTKLEAISSQAMAHARSNFSLKSFGDQLEECFQSQI